MEGNQKELTDSEKIRLKRLAKLGEAGASNPTSATNASSAVSNTTAPATGTSPAKGSPSTSTDSTPVASRMDIDSPSISTMQYAKPQVTPTTTKPPPVATTTTSRTPTKTGTVTPSRSINPSLTTLTSVGPSKQLTLFISQTDLEWENVTLEFIFQATLNEKTSKQSKYTYLRELASELNMENITTMSASKKDDIIHARLSLSENRQPTATPLFDYLVGAWRRTLTVRRKLEQFAQQSSEAANLVPKRIQVVDSVKELIMSFSGLVVNPDMADIFPQSEIQRQKGASYLADKLLLHNADESEAQLPVAFLQEFASRFETDGLEEILSPVIAGIAGYMRTQNVSKDVNTPLRAIRQLVEIPVIARSLTKLPSWNPPNTTARAFEVITLLGPFLSRTSILPDVDPTLANTYFPESGSFQPISAGGHDLDNFPIGMRLPGDVRTAQKALRDLSGTLTKTLHDIVMAIVKAAPKAAGSEPDSKEAVLKYFANGINSNSARGKLHVDRQTVATDGFMCNIVNVLLRMSEGFIDTKYSKIHLIDVDYFKYSSRIIITDHTCINSDTNFAEDYFNSWRTSQSETPVANFISDIYYLTLAAQHYGFLSAVRNYGSLLKGTEDLMKQLDGMRSQRAIWQGPVATMNEMMLTRYTQQLDGLIATKLSLDAGLLNPDLLQSSMRFYNLVMTWLIRVLLLGAAVIQPSQGKAPDALSWDGFVRGDTQGLKLFPVPQETTPPLFATLPEWIIDDICEFFMFLCRYRPTVFENNPRDELLTFTMVILQNPTYIKNPYLKSKLVEILFYFTFPLYRYADGRTIGRLDDVFSTHPLAQQYLVTSLLRFYCDVEQTGMHSQFYDKFNIRYHISQIMKVIWNDSGHRTKIFAMSRDVDFFVKFINLLMNDTTYLLDESLSKLAEIHQLQNAMADTATWEAQTQQQRQEREGTLSTLERQAQSYMSLGVETVNMLEYMTGEPRIVQPFMEPGIVDRLAGMLDYNLTTLVGPKSQELKVQSPEKYRFNPKALLTKLVDIYMHLSHRKEFVIAVSKDARSYKKQIFMKAGQIMMKNALKSESEVQALYDFVEKVEQAVKVSAQEDEELGEAPDEFLDQLMFHVMEEPVILPSSKAVVDISTIKMHLLSDPHDPFNRQPLTLDQVIPDVELKRRIGEWKRSAKKLLNLDVDMG
ncbi:hypothetical protein SeMB42_g02682 [Synchytrium endobioticum]|uniref:RING-type E3 ubiquitin transferase n=1 Tax=Synchytrium endobioticum TaxID=286115 RepID=A0A507D7P2_9FUNG|nr:hypothetical protein SeLEV6574_g02990 [Synchytrium endobioticum]TPX49221.1 hypothetical protein SeMB42_g02682 [Synchytrium endobioticum]